MKTLSNLAESTMRAKWELRLLAEDLANAQREWALADANSRNSEESYDLAQGKYFAWIAKGALLNKFVLDHVDELTAEEQP